MYAKPLVYFPNMFSNLRRAAGCLCLFLALPAPSQAVLKMVHEQYGMIDHQMGMSVSWGDYDGNGYPDIFVVGYRRHPEMLYQNFGNGVFHRADTLAGVAAAGQSGFGGGWADYDNDGDLDVFVVNTDGQVSFLYRNNGPNADSVVTFTDVAPAAGMGAVTNAVGAAWADYDGDGYLDLFVANSVGKQDLLYHNVGNGTFLDVAAKSGMADTANGSGVAWGDFDNDGDLDLFVNNGSGQQSFLYRNNGNGTFTNVSAQSGITLASDGQGVAWCDYDNDGDLDLYAANYGGKPDYLYRNNGDGTFTEVSAQIGLKSAAKSRGVAWADYDNDGDFDLFVSVDWGAGGMLFRNNGNGTFTNVTEPMGIYGGWAISAAWADYDMDGDLDLYVTTQVSHQDLFYQNDDTGGLNWIKVNALTRGPRSSKKNTAPVPYRLALGARVEVDLDGGADFAKGPGRYVGLVVGSGDGFANSAIPVHVGVRRAKQVDVRVTFPTGEVVKLTNVPVNQMITVKDK